MTRRPFIVAELSANHRGNLNNAMLLVGLAAEAGADAIKLQTYIPERMVASGARIEGGPWHGRRALDLYRESHTPREWHAPLFKLAQEKGMVGFSSVFHPDDVDFLETLGCPIYKIASFELTDHTLIERAARTGKPLIISTGMGTEDEIQRAARAAQRAGCSNLTLLKCSSAYPAPMSELNLNAMPLLDYFQGCTAFGFSDHTLTSTAAIAATALGAEVIEKHLTIRRADGGPDAAFSVEVQEFAQMVHACRQTVEAMGQPTLGPTPSEASSQRLRRPPGGYRGDIS